MLGFWIFMLIMVLLLPVTMIGFGKAFLNKPPKKINALYGYRTAMSMKNDDTWIFAHKYCGKLWFKLGIGLLPISLLPLLFVFDKSAGAIGLVGGIVGIMQVVLMAVSIIPTEIALKKTFDQNGNWKNKNAV